LFVGRVRAEKFRKCYPVHNNADILPGAVLRRTSGQFQMPGGHIAGDPRKSPNNPFFTAHNISTDAFKPARGCSLKFKSSVSYFDETQAAARKLVIDNIAYPVDRFHKWSDFRDLGRATRELNFDMRSVKLKGGKTQFAGDQFVRVEWHGQFRQVDLYRGWPGNIDCCTAQKNFNSIRRSEINPPFCNGKRDRPARTL